MVKKRIVSRRARVRRSLAKSLDPDRAQQLAAAQQKAAELVLGDEAWRDGLEDDQATMLLNAALAKVDTRLSRAALEGTLTEESPYDAADEARRELSERAAVGDRDRQ